MPQTYTYEGFRAIFKFNLFVKLCFLTEIDICLQCWGYTFVRDGLRKSEHFASEPRNESNLTQYHA